MASQKEEDLKSPEECPPSEFDNGISSLLIIKTSDGMVQNGFATIFKGKVHDWFVMRTKRGEQYVPDPLGEQYSVGCFHGVKVEGWSLMPAAKDILRKSRRRS